jgi:hypothetical protein
MAGRHVLTQPERAMKKQLKLDRWAKNGQRRQDYFELIDLIIEKLTTIKGGVAPGDRAIVGVLAAGMSEDPSITDHVLKRNLADPPWEDINRACAGTMLEGYLREKGETSGS